MNATCFSFAFALSAPAWTAAPGHCPNIALGDLVPPLLLRRRPYFRFSTVLALKPSINVEPLFNEIRDAIAIRRAQTTRVDQNLASQKLLPLSRFLPGVCEILFHRLFRALGGSALQDPGSTWAIASHETLGSGPGFVANHFDVVPVRANDEGCIVVRVVLRAHPRRTIVFATRL